MLLLLARDLIEPAMEVVELCFDRGVAAVVVLNFVAQREGDKEVDHDLDHVRAEGDDPTFQEGVHAVGGLACQKVLVVLSYQVTVYSRVDDYREEGDLYLG